MKLEAMLVVLAASQPPQASVDVLDLVARRATWDLPRSAEFVENLGQWDTTARFVGRGAGMTVLAEPGAIGLQLPGDEAGKGLYLRLVFEGARADAPIVGDEPLRGARHYFLGNDPARWRSDVPAYEQLHYCELYPGIDLLLRFDGSSLEYDLLLEPGADLSRVVLRCEGASALVDDGTGGLVAHTEFGELLQRAGPTWQVEQNGVHVDRACLLRSLGGTRFGLEVPGREAGLATVIDPSLTWSTYLGGSNYNQSPGDRALAVTVHAGTGDVFVVGATEGADFPQTPGTWQQNSGLGADVFVTRLRAADGALGYSSVLGGTDNQEYAQAVAVDSAGRAAVVGVTFSADFPATPGALDTTKTILNGSGFVLRLSPMGGRLEYCTYLEGIEPLSGTEPWAVVALDSGAAIVAGNTTSPSLPLPPGGFDSTVVLNEGFVVQLHPSGGGVDWGTFLGGSSHDWIHALKRGSDGTITVGGSTNSTDFPTTPRTWQSVWVGTDSSNGFVTRLAADGSALVWSTLLGGAGANHNDDVTALDLLPDGGVVVGGVTSSWDNFPITPGAFQTTYQGEAWDAFITRFDPLGASLVYSTYIGSPTAVDFMRGLAVDSSGVVTFTAYLGIWFPTTPGSWGPVSNPGGDFVVARLHPSGSSLLYSTFLGGPNIDNPYGLAMTAEGRVTVCGATFYGGYPTTPGSAQPDFRGGQTDAVVTTFDLLLEGVEILGASAPSCRGPVQLNTTRMPLAGDAHFGLWCSGAPPFGEGWLVLGSPASAAQAVFGAEIWIDLARRYVRQAIRADSHGFAEVHLGATIGPAGSIFAAQCVFLGTATCPGRTRLCASNGLRIRVQ